MTNDFFEIRLLADHGPDWSKLVRRAVAKLGRFKPLLTGLPALVVSSAFIAAAVLPGQIGLAAGVVG